MELFNMSHNFNNYRKYIQKINFPAVPLLNIITKDLTSLEEIPNEISLGIINFEKLRKLYKIINK